MYLSVSYWFCLYCVYAVAIIDFFFYIAETFYLFIYLFIFKGFLIYKKIILNISPHLPIWITAVIRKNLGEIVTLLHVKS